VRNQESLKFGLDDTVKVLEDWEKSSPMNVSERVTLFVRKQRGIPYCDGCVAAELRTKGNVGRMLERMSAAYTRREVMKCTRCGEHKLATVSRPEMYTASGRLIRTKPRSN